MSTDIELVEPTPEQCSENAKVFESERKVAYAIWFPQIGGYVGRALAIFDRKWQDWPGWKSNGGCIEVYVWHDGEFPFTWKDERGKDKLPTRLHICDPGQFVRFGWMLRKLNNKGREEMKG